MHFISALFFLAFVTSTQASTLTVIGPCDEKPILATADVPHDPTTLGDFTIKILSMTHLPFKGTREGIVSIQNSPSGDAALEVLNNRDMRAYGWCVSVDGKQPSRMPHQVPLASNSKVVWFYAYASMVNGEWKEFCLPSYKLKSPYICSKKLW